MAVLPQICTGDPVVISKMEARNRKRDQTLNVEKVLPDGAWRGQRCFIIGGGPSLTGFDFSCLEGERVIAINKAFRDVPFADIVYFMDFIHFYSKIKDGKFGEETLALWNEFKGLKIFSDSQARNLPDVYWINLAPSQHAVSRSQKRGLHRGTNCGYGAINLSILLGANPIYLLGYDMRHDGDRTHYHEGYNRTAKGKFLLEFAGEMRMISKDIKARGFKVVNLNQKSALRCFKFSTIDMVLNNDNII